MSAASPVKLLLPSAVRIYANLRFVPPNPCTCIVTIKSEDLPGKDSTPLVISFHRTTLTVVYIVSTASVSQFLLRSGLGSGTMQTC